MKSVGLRLKLVFVLVAFVAIGIFLLLSHFWPTRHEAISNTPVDPNPIISPTTNNEKEKGALFAILKHLVERDIYANSKATRLAVHQRLREIENSNYLITCMEWMLRLDAPLFVDGWANASASQKHVYLRSSQCSIGELYLLGSSINSLELSEIVIIDIDGELAAKYAAHIPMNLRNSLLEVEHTILDRNPHWSELLRKNVTQAVDGMDDVPRNPVDLLEVMRVIAATDGPQKALEYLHGLSGKISPDTLGWNYASIIEMACEGKPAADVVAFVRNAGIPEDSLSKAIECATEIVGKTNEEELILLVSMINDHETFEKVGKRWFDSTQESGPYRQWYNTQSR
jgi:hypothetical protein